MGRPVKHIHRKIAYFTARALYDVLKKGRPVHAEDGTVLYHKPASAADITASIKFLQTIAGVTPGRGDREELIDHMEQARREIGLTGPTNLRYTGAPEAEASDA